MANWWQQAVIKKAKPLMLNAIHVIILKCSKTGNFFDNNRY